MRDDRSTVHRGSKQPSGMMRWLGILVRTGHIGVAAVFFGGCVLHVPYVQLALWHHLTIATGGTLLILEWLHDPRWPHRGKGLLGILHLCLAVIIHLTPAFTVPLLWVIVITGGIGSHMPRRFRHWSMLNGPEVRESKERS